MSAVTPFPGAIITSDRKAFFLNEIAASFDRYVADYGHEPEAFVIVQGGLKQPARCSYTMQGETEGGAGTMLALAAAVLLKECVNPGA